MVPPLIWASSAFMGAVSILIAVIALRVRWYRLRPLRQVAALSIAIGALALGAS